MKISKEKFVSGATKWIGTREGDANHKKILSIYNGQTPLPRGYRLKVTDAWCAGFATAVAVETGCGDVFPRECSCWYMEKLAGQMGYIIDRGKTDVGDVVLYDWEQDGTVDHVGIVVQRNGNTLKVVEGNMNNGVGYRNVGIQSKNIRTVFRIPFAESGSGNTGGGSTGGKKSVDEIARECIKGQWGNGKDRQDRLTAAGYDYDMVQRRVNEILRGGGDKKSVDEIARECIRGNWGNGKDRRNRLIAAGYDYTKVQQRVNEILRTGK
jgi:hypothetical protein